MTEQKAEPPDPMTAMTVAAAAIHEMFESYVAAGFSRGEAIQLVAAIVVGQTK